MASALLLVAPRADAVLPPAAGGPLPPEVRAAVAEGLIRPAQSQPAKGGMPAVETAPPSGRWNVPVLLVDFPDRRATYPATSFTTMLFDTTGLVPTGSVAQYYDEVSNGKLTFRGQVFGWKTLADTMNFYANDSYGLSRLSYPQNDAGMMYKALQLFDPEIDFSKFDKNGDGFVDCVLLVHSDMGAEGAAGDRRRFWSITSPFSNQWGFVGPYVTNDPWPGHTGQFMKIDQFSILPEKSAVELNQFTEIGVYCHEFGHDLGWPDLYDTSNLGGGANLGPANWCLMSTGAYGLNSHQPERPTHPCAWALADAGWITVENLTTDGERTFEPIETAHKAYRLWYQGETSTESFLLENRQPIGFDAGLPGHGLLISRIRDDVFQSRRGQNTVNSSFPPALRIEEADGHYDMTATVNRGDSHDPFPGTFGRTRFADNTLPSTITYSGRPLNTSLEAIKESAGEVEAYVQLLPSGWSAPADLGLVGAGATLVGNGAHPLVADATNDLWLALNDDPTGQLEVELWRKRYGVAWTAPTPFTNEPGLSSSPVIARAADGTMALVWWDTRDGNSEIYYAWGPPGGPFGPARRITNQAAFSQLPVAAFRADGRLVVVWADGRDGGSALYSRTFFPDQEGSAPDVRVTFPEAFALTSNSAAPSIATLDNRVAVAFQERISGTDEVEVVVDSAGAYTAQRRLSVTDGFTSNQPTLVAQGDTAVALLWRDNMPTGSQIRQGRWSPMTGWTLVFDSPYVTTLPIDSPRALIDAAGDTHVLFTRTNSSGHNELVESIRHRTLGAWDWGPALLTRFDTDQLVGAAFTLDPLGRTHVLWISQDAAGKHLKEMVRAAPASAPVAVPDLPAPALAQVRATPDPARGRVTFEYATPAPRLPGTRVELVNVAGRRVASFDGAGKGAAQLTWRGESTDGARVPPGVLFVRVVAPGGGTLARGRFVWLP